MQATPSGPAGLCVVVPAHNEAACIEATLAAITQSLHTLGWQERSELIVVDDASSDDTADIAQRAGARVLRVEHRQIASTRNAGAAASTAPWLLFVDADTVVNPAVVGAALAALQGGAVGGGAGVEFDEPIPRWVRHVLPFGLWVARRIRLAAGCFLYCRRLDFEAVGGFDPGIFAGEELHLSRALSRRGRFVVLHEKVLSSGRKLRTYGPRELLAALWRIVAAGSRGLRTRDGLDLWYAPRRHDPRDGPGRRDLTASNPPGDRR